MIYLIIKQKSIHHEGDERSRTHPGHGYPEWTETVQEVTEYTDYSKFCEDVKRLELYKEQYKAYSAEPVTVTTTVDVNVKVVK